MALHRNGEGGERRSDLVVFLRSCWSDLMLNMGHERKNRTPWMNSRCLAKHTNRMEPPFTEMKNLKKQEKGGRVRILEADRSSVLHTSS